MSAILAILGTLFLPIVEVFAKVLINGPAIVKEVKIVETTLEIDTSIDNINTQYKWLLDRD